MAKRPPRSQADELATKSRGRTETPRETQTQTTQLPPEAFGEPTESNRDTTSRSMGSEPSEEDIRLRAYHRYLERGGNHGMDFDDWLEAERDLKNER
jgi:hypothetical protein